MESPIPQLVMVAVLLVTGGTAFLISVFNKYDVVARYDNLRPKSWPGYCELCVCFWKCVLGMVVLHALHVVDFPLYLSLGVVVVSTPLALHVTKQ